MTLRNGSVRVGGKWILWDTTLDIEKGDLVALFGRPGAGKTVLCKVIAGLIPLTRGLLEWHMPGEEVSTGFHCTRASRWQNKAILAFESPVFARELSVYENLCLFQSLIGSSRRVRDRQIAFVLELLDLATRRSCRCWELSAGELKRLEIARVLLADVPVIIMDSLLETLERRLLEKVWDYILIQRRESEKSFIISTSSSRIATLCPRMSVVHRGHVVFSGRPEDFRKLGGEDVVVLAELSNPALRERIAERLSVVIKEEEGFLAFRVSNVEKTLGSLLAEFGSEIGCVYLRRPTLDDALDVLESGSATVATYGVRQE
ncbi:MAG: ABC transporter ATP-binding protein [Armatimonadota bacterium]